MPKNVHLLTLDRIVQKETTLLLLRLEHALEKDQNNGKNQDAIVDLEASFVLFLMSLHHSLDAFTVHNPFIMKESRVELKPEREKTGNVRLKNRETKV